MLGSRRGTSRIDRAALERLKTQKHIPSIKVVASDFSLAVKSCA